MAIRLSIPVLAIFSFLILLDHFPSSTEAHAAPQTGSFKLAQSVCKKTNIIDACLKVFANPEAFKSHNILSLAKFALSTAINQGKKAQGFFGTLMKKRPDLKVPLSACISSYGDMILSFHSSLLELKEDAMTANYDAKVAGDGVGMCERALAKFVIPPEVAARNKEMMDFSTIGYAVTDALQTIQMNED